MKIDTLGVQAFIAIADRGSFSRAAQDLHITQTALSRRMQNLESFLGVKLVERTTRSVALTEDHTPDSNALRAPRSAASRSSGPALATSPIAEPVEGSCTVKVAPSAASRNWPPISSCVGNEGVDMGAECTYGGRWLLCPGWIPRSTGATRWQQSLAERPTEGASRAR